MRADAHVVHVIAGLQTGGAETMLYKLLHCGRERRSGTSVISLTEVGPLGEKLTALGIEVVALGMRRSSAGPRDLWKLSSALRRRRPALIQSWMYHADLLAGIASLFAGGVPIVWSIRRSGFSGVEKRRTFWPARACAALSRFIPARIVCCSQAARISHEALGYAPEKIVVIPNGFDLHAFQADAAARTGLRRELGLAEHALLVGLFARYQPEKDHATFIRAAALCKGAAHFVLCGEGASPGNRELVDLVSAHHLGDRVHLLGKQDRMPWLTAALDVACSSSITEGFPNVVGEAMASEVPCVVTDVGDASYLVGDTGHVVPPSDAPALAAAVDAMLSFSAADRKALGVAARKRVASLFDIEQIAARYQALHEEVIRSCAA